MDRFARYNLGRGTRSASLLSRALLSERPQTHRYRHPPRHLRRRVRARCRGDCKTRDGEGVSRVPAPCARDRQRRFRDQGISVLCGCRLYRRDRPACYFGPDEGAWLNSADCSSQAGAWGGLGRRFPLRTPGFGRPSRFPKPVNKGLEPRIQVDAGKPPVVVRDGPARIEFDGYVIVGQGFGTLSTSIETVAPLEVRFRRAGRLGLSNHASRQDENQWQVASHTTSDLNQQAKRPAHRHLPYNTRWSCEAMVLA